MWKRSKTNNKDNPKHYDTLIKASLVAHLGEAVRELQRQQAANELPNDSVDSSGEAAHSLCCVIEALFIHKLRDSFADKVSNVFSAEVIRHPAPSFWSFLVAFSHRNSIDFLSRSCSWLRSDIGRCRGWIRLVLNDGMLSSYLELLATERRVLNDFYDKEAFLRDTEHLDIARNMLNGIDMLQFRLAVNSSMLNNWSTTPLLLAGLGAPPTPVVSEAVVLGVDASLCFPDEHPKEQSQPVNAYAPVTVDQDLAFRLIVESQRSLPKEIVEAHASTSLPACSAVPATVAALDDDDDNNVAGPSPREVEDVLGSEKSGTPPQSGAEQLLGATALDVGAVADLVEAGDLNAQVERLSLDCGLHQQGPSIVDRPAESATFEDLLDNYATLTCGSLSKSPSLNEGALRMLHQKNSPDDFEVISDEDKCNSAYMDLVMTLNNERGLVSQNYRCLDCGRLIGLLYGPAKVCGLTGGSYCQDCHLDEESIIPARAFLNGDLSKRKVCRTAYDFLVRVEAQPLFDAVKLNRTVYAMSDDFGRLLTARTQLRHLWAYLLTCHSEASGELRRRIWPKEHLYEQLHTYCGHDLQLIQSGQLLPQLVKLVQFAKSHVLACQLCSLKGFVCEVCHSKSILYPFDLETTFRCPTCGAVFHRQCMDQFKPCPRCLRWKKVASSEL